MHGSEPLDSLDFDDHSTFDHKVRAIPAVELDILVHHREWLLLLNFEAALSEFEDETRLVGRLQQPRSEEHTSELQSRLHLVCRLLLEKKKNTKYHPPKPTLQTRPNTTSPPATPPHTL